MLPVYVDIHIHTSENPNCLEQTYNVAELRKRITGLAGDKHPVLISLSDHNTINKTAYMELQKYFNNIVIGAEIHIKKYDSAPPYHCHILFNVNVTSETIDSLNGVLDKLYPDKVVKDDSENIPNIEDISNAFDAYEFMLLPHGGQSHRTFDKATAKGHIFDNSLERSLYYNHFEGFTARSNTGLNETIEYFKRLGIDQFTNLVTCSDNYCPERYPDPKGSVKEEFIPTWMLSEPTFNGLRLALSESSRLFYSLTPPEEWSKSISKVELHSKLCEINVEMTPGLNVVIGGSSSGKTLFVDSIACGIKGDFINSPYKDFGVENIKVDNPSGIQPHYINQNFIVSVLQNNEMNIGDIPIISEVFPEDFSVTEMIRKNLMDVKHLIEQMIDSAKEYLHSIEQLSHVVKPSHLVGDKITKQIATTVKPKSDDEIIYNLSTANYDRYLETLDEIKILFSKSSGFVSYIEMIDKIREGVKSFKEISNLSDDAIEAINKILSIEIGAMENEDRERSQRIEQRNIVFENVKNALSSLEIFYDTRDKLSKLDVSFDTKTVEICGHELSIENRFKLTEDILTNALNKNLKANYRVKSFSAIEPSSICEEAFSDRPRVKDHTELSEKVYSEIATGNKKRYRIKTSAGKDFDELSPGWKSAVILDLILGYKKDVAPLIIDQPEDNLATDYINHGLVDHIKTIKSDKQVILVSHNATIPMIGDAQNIIVCQNLDGKIIIESAPLESSLKGKRTLDYIAEITDGGKPSIKKRVKKYDLKRYQEGSV